MNTLFLFLTVSTLITSHAKAEVVEFPEEQLARESVSPVFDQPTAVKKRYVPVAERFEFSVFSGATLSDAFFNSIPVGARVGYHLSEVHSFHLTGSYVFSSQSSYVGQIQAQTTSAGGPSIPFPLAPSPNYFGLLEYEFTPYYGKISLTKQTVINLSMSASLGVGYIGLTSEGSPMGAIGLNERFFFTRNLGIIVDLRALLYQETDVVLANVQTSPSKTNVTNVLFTAGVIYFLPSL